MRMSYSSSAIRCQQFQGAREGCLDKDQMKAGKKDDADEDQVNDVIMIIYGRNLAR